MPSISRFVPRVQRVRHVGPQFPICPICNEPVEIETVRTDENGKTIHDECYCSGSLPTSQKGSRPMEGETRDHWQRVCKQAAIEQDPERLTGLIFEINRLFDKKEQHLRQAA